MSSHLEQLGAECLKVQLSLAAPLATKLKHRIYLFTPSNYFDTQPFDIVIINNVRTVLKENRTALLSSAAQAIIKTSACYRSLIPQDRISSDSIGVYINP